MQSTVHSENFFGLKKVFAFIAIFSIFCLGGCGDVKYDSRDPDSLTRMISGMSAKEQIEFLSDFKLSVYLHDGRPGLYGDGSYVLNGLTVQDIKKEARLAPGYIKERNSKFITKVLATLDEQGADETCIYQNEFGFLMPPRMDVRPQDSCKTFSRDELNTILKDSSPGQNSGFDLQPQKKIAEEGAQTSKLIGDLIDSNPNATPRSEEELKNKQQKKNWQDENGFMHYPDGSVSASPID